MARHTWTVWSLDVWGNKRDGWEVNDRSQAGKVLLNPNPSDKNIIRVLKENGFIKKGIHLSSIKIDDLGDGLISIDQAKDGQPVYQLEMID